MIKKYKKACAIALVSGTLLQFGGCIGGLWNAFLTNAPTYLLLETVLDSEIAGLDLFSDDGPGVIF